MWGTTTDRASASAEARPRSSWPRDFHIFTAGACISECGDAMSVVVISLAIYRASGTVDAIGVMWIIRALVRVMVQPLTGVVVDRHDKKAILIVTSLLMALVALGMGVHARNPLVMLGLVGVQQLLSATYGPAAGGLMPQVVPSAALLQANSRFRAAQNVARLAGPVVGATLFHAVGAAWVFGLNAASYVVLAMCLATLKIRPQPGTLQGSFSAQLRDGLRAVSSSPLLTALLLLALLDSMAWRAVEIMLVPATNGLGALGATALGAGYTALTAGALVGSLAATRFSSLDRPRHLFALYGILSVPLAAMALHFTFSTFVAGMFVSGVILDLFGIACMTLIQKECDADMLGRVFSLQGTATALGAIPVGLTISPLSHRMTPLHLILLAAVLTVVTMASVALVYRRRLAVPGVRTGVRMRG